MLMVSTAMQTASASQTQTSPFIFRGTFKDTTAVAHAVSIQGNIQTDVAVVAGTFFDDPNPSIGVFYTQSDVVTGADLVDLFCTAPTQTFSIDGKALSYATASGIFSCADYISGQTKTFTANFDLTATGNPVTGTQSLMDNSKYIHLNIHGTATTRPAVGSVNISVDINFSTNQLDSSSSIGKAKDPTIIVSRN